MNKKLLKLANKFTWGYEIEGAFHNNLTERIHKHAKENNYELNYRHDSSVEVYAPNNNWNICDCCDSEEYGEDRFFEEITLGVFNDFKTMLSTLKFFKDDKNYIRDNSCAIHIHIKPKKHIKETRSRIGDIKLIKKLEDFAFTKLCKETQRRKTNHYCQPYSSYKDNQKLYDWKRGKKYSFVRNHDIGTLEFRFFSTCHRKENIVKFFEYFLTELENVKNYKTLLVKFKNPKTKLKENHQINDQLEIIKRTYPLKDTLKSENVKIDLGKINTGII